MQNKTKKHEKKESVTRAANADPEPQRRDIDMLEPSTVHSRQKFPKLWTSVAHSFLQQIAQNKNRAHPKDTTLPRIYEVEMQHASLLFYLAKPQSGGILGCAQRHCTSEPFDSRRLLRSLPSVRSVTQFPAWSRCRCSTDVPRADHDHVGWSPLEHGFKERDTLHALLPCVWFFRHLKMQPPLSSSSTKEHWCDRPSLVKNNLLPILVIQSRQDTHPKNWTYALKLKIDTQNNKLGLRGWHEEVFPENLSSIGLEINFLKSKFGKKNLNAM